MPKIIKAFCLNESKKSKCNKAITDLVLPHPGQLMWKSVYVIHGGKEILFATYTANIHNKKTATKGTKNTSTFFTILLFITFLTKKTDNSPSFRLT